MSLFLLQNQLQPQVLVYIHENLLAVRKFCQVRRVIFFFNACPAIATIRSAALFIFAYKDYLYLWLVVIIVVRDLLITALWMYALQQGKVIITSSFAKIKTFIQMGFVLMMILYLTFPILPDITLSYTWDDWLMWPTILGVIVAILTAASGVHYIFYNRSHINEIFKRLTRKWQA